MERGQGQGQWHSSSRPAKNSKTTDPSSQKFLKGKFFLGKIMQRHQRSCRVFLRVCQRHFSPSHLIMDGYQELERIIKSPLDPLEYKAIKLSNGLRALVISTEKGILPPAHKRDLSCVMRSVYSFNDCYFGMPSPLGPSSSVREDLHPLKKDIKPPQSLHLGGKYRLILSVGSGMLADGDVPGIAHFVEHLTFFGSKKYKETDGLTLFMGECGGDTNATTDAEATMYEMTVPYDALEGSLDRFSNLFKAPHWTEKDVRNEIHSMDSEFWGKWVTYEDIRYKGLLHRIANPCHPISNVSFGNGHLLDLPDIREQALEWRDNHYTPDNIAIVFMGPLPVGELAAKVVKYFGALPPSTEGPCWRHRFLKSLKGKQPFAKEDWNATYEVYPSTQDRLVFLSWMIPADVWKNRETSPLNFLHYVIAYRGRGGLDYYLRHKGWLLDLCIHCHAPQQHYLFSLFQITMKLTEEGFENREEVVKEVFWFLQMVTLTKQRDSLKRMFQEFRQVQADAFHFRSDGNIVNHHMEDISPEDIDQEDGRGVAVLKILAKYILEEEGSLKNILLNTFVTRKWDEGLVISLLGKLADPNNGNVMFCSTSFSQTRMEKWYSIPFQKAETNILTKANVYGKWWRLKYRHADIDKYTLPTERNSFTSGTHCIPIPATEVMSSPLVQDGLKRFYFEAQPECPPGFLPTFSYTLTVKSDAGLSSIKPPKKFAWMHLLVKCLHEVLYTKLADVLASTIDINMKASSGTFGVTVQGPSSRLHIVFDKVVRIISELEDKISPTLLKNMIEESVADWRQGDLWSQKYGRRFIPIILDEHVCNFQYQDENFLNETQHAPFITWVKEVKNRMKVELDVAGCFRTCQYHSAVKRTKTLIFLPRDEGKKPCGKNHRLGIPPGTSCFKILSKNPLEAHHWIHSYYEIGCKPEHKKLSYALIGPMGNLIYYHLRTKQQIGYTPSAEIVERHSVLGLQIGLEALAFRFTSDAVEERIDAYLDEFYEKYLNNREYYDDHIAPLVENQGLSCTWAQVKSFYQKYFVRTGKEFRKLCVHVLGKEANVHCSLRRDPNARPIQGVLGRGEVTLITDIPTFKAGLRRYPNTRWNDESSSEEDDED